MNNRYDTIIVGAGPAGLTAALYALRASKSVLVIEQSTFGGQVTFSPKIENYPGAAEPVYATLLVYKNKIIGGDITDTAANGTMRALTKLEQAPQENTAPTESTLPAQE